MVVAVASFAGGYGYDAMSCHRQRKAKTCVDQC